MRNTIKLQSRLFCAIALLAIIGFSMAACSSDGGESVSLPGTTWKGTITNDKGVVVTMTLTFTASTFKTVFTAPGNSSQTLSGTYTFNGHSGTMKFSTGESESFSVSGNKLTVKERDGNKTFTKQ